MTLEVVQAELDEVLHNIALVRQELAQREGALCPLRAKERELRLQIAVLKGEPAALDRRTTSVVRSLILLALLGIAGAVLPLLSPTVTRTSWLLIIACISGGVAGSSIAALLSACERRANGFEFADGTPYPDQAKKERFNHNIVPFFYARPFLGATTGLLVYLGLGQIVTRQTTPEPPLLIFFAVLAGLFAKTLLGRLREVFSDVIGKRASGA